jgi:hypothetical protein
MATLIFSITTSFHPGGPENTEKIEAKNGKDENPKGRLIIFVIFIISVPSVSPG